MKYLVATAFFLMGAAFIASATPTPKIKVFVIDTGVERNHPALKKYNIDCLTSGDCTDTNGHGTQITSLIVNGILNSNQTPTSAICEEVEIEICNYAPGTSDLNYFSCLARAISYKPIILNFSSTSTVPSFTEYRMIKELVGNGTTFVAATGNESSSLFESPRYPIMYMYTKRLFGPLKELEPLKGIVPVAASTYGGGLYIMSNTIDGMVTEPGVFLNTANKNGEYVRVSGTSASAAIHTNKLIRKLCEQLSK